MYRQLLNQLVFTTTRSITARNCPSRALVQATKAPAAEPQFKINRVTAKDNPAQESLCYCDDPMQLSKCSKSSKCQYRVEQVPVYIKVYGCQMNKNDGAIVASILQEYGYQIVDNRDKAEIHLLITCAIRDSAEKTIWERLHYLKELKQSKSHPLKQIGLLGCMAERLKEKALSARKDGVAVDIIAGPDAYRDLPRLFAVNKMTRDKAVNCLLSFDETYSDIRPVTKINDVSSFVSITRGCDNLCSYCIVPFTRGKERSRELTTILDEVKGLMERGIKEVTLLGQNVNSYRDVLTPPESINRPDLVETVRDKESPAQGFKTVYKPRVKGLTFDILLEEVAKLSPELRIRFTSPHPKDFTDDVIDVMRRYRNIARCVHLPLQSGSNRILEKMRRGHTREAYLALVERFRSNIPDIAFTTDIIAGFCGETEKDHNETLDTMERVKYRYVFNYMYSMRDKTHAYHTMKDDVALETKSRRLQEINILGRDQAQDFNNRLVGTEQLVLIERRSKRSTENWSGLIDSGTNTVVVTKEQVKDRLTGEIRPIELGDYVVCRITHATSQSILAEPLYVTSQADYL